jgi:hypothetical protein
MRTRSGRMARSTGVMLVVAGLVVSSPLGCKKDSGPTEPSQGGNPLTISILGVITLPTFGIQNIRSYLAVVPGTASTEGVQPDAFAVFFGATTSQLLYAGDVSINANQLDTANIAGQVVYTKEDLTGVNFDGSTHAWMVSGSASVAGFNANVSSPVGSVSVTSPTTGATIPRNQSLTVTWSPAGGASDTVLVMVNDAANNLLYAAAAGGSHTFPSSQLGTLIAGQATVGVFRYGLAVVPVTGGNHVAFSASGSEIDATLN